MCTKGLASFITKIEGVSRSSLSVNINPEPFIGLTDSMLQKCH